MQTVLVDSSFMKLGLGSSLVDWIFLLFRRLKSMEASQIANFKSKDIACVEAIGRLVVGDL